MKNNQKEKIFSNKFIQNFLENKSTVNFKNKYKFKRINLFKWNELMQTNAEKIDFKRFDFETELAILYSSGTTGKPKCICHRSGGVLIQHMKEHQLHCNIKENDNVFYFYLHVDG